MKILYDALGFGKELAEGLLFIVAFLLLLVIVATIVSSAVFIVYSLFFKGRLNGAVYNAAFCIDEWADKMDSKESRKQFVRDIGSLLTWRKILIPDIVIEYTIKLASKSIHFVMEKTCDTNFHDESKEKEEEK